MELISIRQVLQVTSRQIAPIDARMLLQYVLNESPVFLHTHDDQTLTSQQQQHFSQLVARRLNGEPVAYLTGEREFYDLTFKVTPAVLIPRPETELLVELALQRLPVDQVCHVLDLGTGSGAIALTIAKQRPRANIVAVDISIDAIEIARVNAENMGIKNVSIIIGNWFNELCREQFDLIISNPPYVAAEDSHLKRGDLRFEPQVALIADADGLSCLHEIISTAPKYLLPDGWLLVEHGYDQAGNCRQLLETAGFSHTFSSPDLAGIMRVSGGQVLR